MEKWGRERVGIICGLGALKTMTKDSQELWKALCELGDYFSRLGGSARYFNMSESEIPLYVASRLMQRYMPSFELEDFIDRRFLEAASPVLDKADAHIDAVSVKGGALVDLIIEFIRYADSKLKLQDRSSQWNRFIEVAYKMGAQHGAPERKLTLEKVLAEVQKNKRVCPQPQKWQQLYEMLPQKQRKGAGWEPPLPLILAAWHDTTAILKKLRLREHIEWAETHGCLDEVVSFLERLSEDEWHHIGE
ncbi:MAG: hypothetical protein SWC96_00340 [Thermodesulfobacteriota bacterium]|nr:hypothetical protein [Thermodesulfobacteriota bacterium]